MRSSGYLFFGEFLQRLYQPILVWGEISGFWLTLADFRTFLGYFGGISGVKSFLPFLKTLDMHTFFGQRKCLKTD